MIGVIAGLSVGIRLLFGLCFYYIFRYVRLPIYRRQMEDSFNCIAREARAHAQAEQAPRAQIKLDNKECLHPNYPVWKCSG